MVRTRVLLLGAAGQLGTGACIGVRGEMVASPGEGQSWEVQAEQIIVYGETDDSFPLQKKRHSFEFLRSIAHLRPRTNAFGAVFRVRSRIAHAVHDAIAGRVGSVTRIVGLQNDVVMIGGVARNVGFMDSLRKELSVDVAVPDDPDYVGALGAAVAASAGVLGEEIKAKVVERETVEEGK